MVEATNNDTPLVENTAAAILEAQEHTTTGHINGQVRYY